MGMTKEKIQKCIDLLNTDGINSKEQVKKILQGELESIDNANPSEALDIFSKVDNVRLLFTNEERNTIKQALLKAEEQENSRSEEILQKYYQEGITLDSVRALKQERDNYKKSLEIIKEKNLWVARLKGLFKKYNNDLDVLRIYNANMPSIDYQLTQEEYETIKEVLK